MHDWELENHVKLKLYSTAVLKNPRTQTLGAELHAVECWVGVIDLCIRIDRVTIPSVDSVSVSVASPLRPNHSLGSLYMLSIA